MKFKEKINYILNSRQKIYLFCLLAGSIVVSFLEMIGIGSIGLFVAILSDNQNFIDKIPIKKVQVFLQESKLENIIIISGILLSLIFIFKNFILIFYNYFEQKVRINIYLNLSKKTYSNYLYRDISFHKKKNSAELINNVTGKSANAAQYLLAMISTFKELILILFLIYGLFWLNINFSLYILITITILSCLLYFGIKNIIKKIGKKSLILEEKRLQSLNEGLGGIKITKVLNNYNFFINELNLYNSKRYSLDLIVRMLNLLPRLFLEIFAVIAMALITIYLMKTNLLLTEVLPLLTMTSVIIIRMIPAFTNLSMSLQNMRYLRSPFDDISNELKEDYKLINITSTKENTLKNISEIDSLLVKDLNFGYEDKKDLIKNLNINIKKGQFTALIGDTGSGKTTLIDIILGLIKPDSGKLIVNNKHEFEDFKILNHLIGYVPQDIYLSDTSIINNIAAGQDEKKINIDQVKKVIKLSQLNTFIDTLEDGIYSKVGDRGFRISGGQKQRIGIARALYRNPKILIMDESTNSLDEQAEKAFLKDIKLISKDIITIFITHKINNLTYCDVVHKLDHGKLTKYQQ